MTTMMKKASSKPAATARRRPVGYAQRVGVMQEYELLATLAAHVSNGDVILAVLDGRRRRQEQARVDIMKVALRRDVTKTQATYSNMREVLQVALGVVGVGSIEQVERAIIALVREHAASERRKGTMSADDIMKVWRSW